MESSCFECAHCENIDVVNMLCTCGKYKKPLNRDDIDRAPLLCAYYAPCDSVQNSIADSGDRTTFGTGAVRDMHAGKGRMDLLPWNAIMQVSKHCEAGAQKYGEHNVDRGIPVHSLMDSGLRHAAKHLTGQTDEPHLVAACWNLLWALEMELTREDMCDIPWTRQE